MSAKAIRVGDHEEHIKALTSTDVLVLRFLRSLRFAFHWSYQLILSFRQRFLSISMDTATPVYTAIHMFLFSRGFPLFCSVFICCVLTPFAGIRCLHGSDSTYQHQTSCIHISNLPSYCFPW